MPYSTFFSLFSYIFVFSAFFGVCVVGGGGGGGREGRAEMGGVFSKSVLMAKKLSSFFFFFFCRSANSSCEWQACNLVSGLVRGCGGVIEGINRIEQILFEQYLVD